MQSYAEITSDKYFDYIKEYVVGIGPWKDTVVPEVNNYQQTPTDLVARAHAHDLQVLLLFRPYPLFFLIWPTRCQHPINIALCLVDIYGLFLIMELDF